MIDLANEFYVYRSESSDLTDIELLGIVGTSIQTIRTPTDLYFGVIEPLATSSAYTLIREPIIEN